MPNQLDRIISFVKKTGDKTIVIKDDSEFIIAPLVEYERLLDLHSGIKNLSEEELLNKINRDVALWRASQPENVASEVDILADAGPRYDRLEDIPLTAPEPDPFSESIPTVDIGADRNKDYWQQGEDWEEDWGGEEEDEDEDEDWDIEREDENEEDEESDEYGDLSSYNFPDFDDERSEEEPRKARRDEPESNLYAADDEEPNDNIEDTNDISDSNVAREDNNFKGFDHKKQTAEVRVAPKIVNNFGYPNPADTVREDKYGHIAPPPDLKKNDKVPF